jgi:hypothetical protein
MRRGLGGRGGRPSLLGTAARTAVIAGTATSVSGRVAARQQAAQQQAVQQQAPPAAPVAAVAQPAPAALSTDDVITQLTKLAELRAANVLTAEEFEVQKARILA